VGLVGGAYCWAVLAHLQIGAGDFNWAIFAARDLLAHKNPYARPMQLYPLPAALFGLPFVLLPGPLAGGLFYGISSGLLAYGLLRNGYHRLLIFLAYPYWAGALTAQWMPLLAACSFFPLLLPATMAKPQIGLPVFLRYPTRRGIVACIAVLVASFLVLPHWPILWSEHFGSYDRFIPLLVLPGPLLLLALLRYRDGDALFLLLVAIMPQRWFYDTFVLWLIPKTRREIAYTAFFSWGAGIWRWYHFPHSYAEVGRWTVDFMYLPMLAIVLARAWQSKASIIPAS